MATTPPDQTWFDFKEPENPTSGEVEEQKKGGNKKGRTGKSHSGKPAQIRAITKPAKKKVADTKPTQKSKRDQKCNTKNDNTAGSPEKEAEKEVGKEVEKEVGEIGEIEGVEELGGEDTDNEEDTEGALEVESSKEEWGDEKKPEEEKPTQHGHYAAYSKVLNQYPLLDEDKEKALVYASRSTVKKKANAAEETLILSNLRLVISMAKKYTRYGCPMEDLVSEGTIGLKVAIGKYNPERGARLSTYAIWWIKQYLRKATNENTRTIRIPIYQQKTVRAIYETTQRLTQVTGHPPSDEEIAEEIGEKVHLVQNLRNLTVPMVSLQDPVGSDEGSKTFGELISDPNIGSPLDHLKKKNSASGILALIEKRLSKKEQEVIRLRFGLSTEGNQCATLEEVGNAMNLTRERIRQIQEQAIAKLKRSLEAQDAQKPTLLTILGVDAPKRQ